MNTANNKANLAQSPSDELQNNTQPILAPLPPPSKFQTPSHKEAFNGASKISVSPQNANLHPSGAEPASKLRLITDFLPRVG